MAGAMLASVPRGDSEVPATRRKHAAAPGTTRPQTRQFIQADRHFPLSCIKAGIWLFPDAAGSQIACDSLPSSLTLSPSQPVVDSSSIAMRSDPRFSLTGFYAACSAPYVFRLWVGVVAGGARRIESLSFASLSLRANLLYEKPCTCGNLWRVSL